METKKVSQLLRALANYPTIPGELELIVSTHVWFTAFCNPSSKEGIECPLWSPRALYTCGTQNQANYPSMQNKKKCI